jgi:hypothetical protein
VDPISDEFAFVSVYNYAENSPIGNIDLWGLQKLDYITSFRIWWEGKKFQWKNDISGGISNMRQGASRSNPAINNSPLSQRGKNFAHSLQTNAGLAEAVKPAANILRFIGELHPLGSATSGALDGVSHANDGNYFLGASIIMMAPLEMGAGGSVKKVIGLGLKDVLHEFNLREVIPYLDGRWQKAGLTDVPWYKAMFGGYDFKKSFEEAAKNADEIHFNIKGFDPFYSKPGMTNFEFDHIINSSSLKSKTRFFEDGVEKAWDGSKFINKN